MEALEYLSAAELGEMIRRKQVSPTEVIRYFIGRIDKRNPALNAFVYTCPEYAEAQAKELEQRLMKERDAGPFSFGSFPLGPFAGVPFALKDFLPSKKGWQNSHGGVRALIRTDPADSEFCRAMEAAGGIALGKTNAPAFGFRGTCDNLLYGPTSTPFDIRYNSGGSSGGSAAAVADGLIPIAEGSDGGGSIRIPAAWCSLFGFKASVGTIPSVCRPDAWAATHPYCFNGGLTKTVEDSAILLNYMARFDPRDPLSVPRESAAAGSSGIPDFTEEMRRGVRGRRFAYTADFGVFPVDPEVARITEQAALRFQEAVAVVEHVDFHLKRSAYELAEMWCRSISADTAIELELDRREGFDLVRDHRGDLPEEFIYWNEQAAKGGIMDYYAFHLVRTEILDALEDVFEQYDYILSPVTICLPVLNAGDRNTKGPREMNGVPVEPLIGFCETFFANFTGHPAASVPAGLSETGLPVGMQIIGRKFRDGDVFAASGAFEKICPWRDYYKIPFSRG
ncbi:MAG: amidase [Stomatobaculum sp.]|nr:amidase [Stomatobaculum sp.]